MVTAGGPGRSLFPHLGPANLPPPITNTVRSQSPTSLLRGSPCAVNCPLAPSPGAVNKATQLMRTAALLIDIGSPSLSARRQIRAREVLRKHSEAATAQIIPIWSR